MKVVRTPDWMLGYFELLDYLLRLEVPGPDLAADDMKALANLERKGGEASEFARVPVKTPEDPWLGRMEVETLHALGLSDELILSKHQHSDYTHGVQCK